VATSEQTSPVDQDRTSESWLLACMLWLAHGHEHAWLSWLSFIRAWVNVLLKSITFEFHLYHLFKLNTIIHRHFNHHILFPCTRLNILFFHHIYNVFSKFSIFTNYSCHSISSPWRKSNVTCKKAELEGSEYSVT
jgi:hypothetical protein